MIITRNCARWARWAR